jgi:hypothetical protein
MEQSSARPLASARGSRLATVRRMRVGRIERPGREPEGAALGRAQVQEIADQPGHDFAVLLERPEPGAGLDVVAEAGLEQLAVAEQALDGRAQLVADLGEEGGLEAVGLGGHRRGPCGVLALVGGALLGIESHRQDQPEGGDEQRAGAPLAGERGVELLARAFQPPEHATVQTAQRGAAVVGRALFRHGRVAHEQPLFLPGGEVVGRAPAAQDDGVGVGPRGGAGGLDQPAVVHDEEAGGFLELRGAHARGQGARGDGHLGGQPRCPGGAGAVGSHLDVLQAELGRGEDGEIFRVQLAGVVQRDAQALINDLAALLLAEDESVAHAQHQHPGGNEEVGAGEEAAVIFPGGCFARLLVPQVGQQQAGDEQLEDCRQCAQRAGGDRALHQAGLPGNRPDGRASSHQGGQEPQPGRRPLIPCREEKHEGQRRLQPGADAGPGVVHGQAEQQRGQAQGRATGSARARGRSAPTTRPRRGRG